MLEDKTANNVQRRFYRTIFADNEKLKDELIVPEGKISITQNDVDIDVAQYAKADVNVSGGATTNSRLTVLSSNFSALTCEYAGIYNDEVDMLTMSSTGTVDTFQFLLGRVYPNSGDGVKIAVTNASNVQYAEVNLPNGQVGTSKGIVFWTYGETASMTIDSVSI